MRKISRPGLVFSKYMELILISCCRFAEGRLRNVPRYKTRMQSITIHIFFCSFTLLFGDVLDRWCLIFAVVLLKPSLNFLRTILILQCCIRWFCFHSLVINILHKNLCGARLNHRLKTQGLGNNEEALVSQFGACYAMMKAKRKKETNLKR